MSSNRHWFKKLFDKIKPYLYFTNFVINKKNEIEGYTYEKLLDLIKSYDKRKNLDTISEHYLFNNIIDLRSKRVHDIMIPRSDIVAIEETSSFDDVFKMVKQYGYSRFPVYKNNLDDLLGFIHIKDLIPLYKKKDTLVISSIMRQVIFVSPYMKIFDLLYEMRIKRVHMAVMVDEFGGVDGLVTFEDVVEEIVGDITDEHDRVPDKVVEVISAGYLEADAKIELDDLEGYTTKFLSESEKEENNTLGGLIVSMLGYIPAKNEIIVHESGVEFKILSVAPIKINRVAVYYSKIITEK